MYHLYAFFESIYLYTGLSLYPLFYTYILKLTTHSFKTPRHLYHFIPGVLFGVVSLVITFILSPEQRIYYVKEVLIETNLKAINFNTLPGIKGYIFLLSRIVFILQTIAYLMLVIRLSNQHNKTINHYFSNTEGKKMNWVRNLSILAFAVSVAAIAFALLGRSYFIHHNLSLLIPSVFFTTIFFLIGYKGNMQREIFEMLYEQEENNADEEIPEPPEDDLKTRLLKLFEHDKIYQVNDLRISTVCESLLTNRTYISKLINDEFEMNFNEFVNKYRVAEAKQLLLSRENNKFTMEYIAQQAGFGSVASFSRVFKEIEGLTPGKYREKNSSKMT
ncbi:helix-turn-helix domain-containing protein [Draconibacterium mangrovi]|uniref:helix-turn-helix domain-containing protein n=1 Tax=Draconibacterium mangrovi TaxID=2697469 RepID=UPI0013D13AEA|nr:helix-turn-helix transcriptional regulator [Draconibacterium mangrovi]